MILQVVPGTWKDVFAGLDLSLRGGWTVYREYFHVGKAHAVVYTKPREP